MKFTSKNQNYHSPQANRGVFLNPYVKTVSTEIDTENERLTVNFALQYEENGVTQTLDRVAVSFNKLGQETKIEDENGNLIEILAFLTAGGTYDATKVIEWGTPSFTNVQGYFDLASVWNDLQFADTPFKQLAIDWVLNSVKIEGLLLKEKFELEVV